MVSLAAGLSIDFHLIVHTCHKLQLPVVVPSHHVGKVVAEYLCAIVGEHGHGEGEVDVVGIAAVVGPTEVLHHTGRIVVYSRGGEVEVAELHHIVELIAFDGFGGMEVHLCHACG